MNVDPKIDALHESHGASFELTEGLNLPRFYSNEPNVLELLAEHCGILDLKACFLIALKGADALNFLQGMLTCDLRPLLIGSVQSGFLCASKGKILHQVEVFRKAEEEYVVCCAAGEGMRVGNHLDHFHISEDFEMRLLNPHLLRCDLIGVQAPSISEKMGMKHPETWTFQNSTVHSFESALGKTSRWIHLIEGKHYADFILGILSQNPDSALMGFDVYRSLHSHEGIPCFAVDYDSSHFPQETGLRNCIAYNQGCYLGQEPHARMFHRGQPKWQLVKIKCPSTVPVHKDSSLYSGSELAGKITSLNTNLISQFKNSPQKHEIQGLAMIRYPLIKEHFTLSLESEGNATISCERIWF